MNKLKQFVLIALMLPITLGSFAFVGATPVAAQDNESNLICRIFPFIEDIQFTRGLCGQQDSVDDSVSDVAQLVRFFLSLIFIGIIALAVFYIIKSAIKYIQSEGDEGGVQESQKAIKAVFMGIGVLLIGIIGLVILISFIGGEEALNQEQDSGIDAVDTFLDTLIEGE